jgi:general secretion pathway protein A
MEFHQHFGLSKPPFEMVGQTTALYMSKSHREGLAALEWGLLHEPGSFTLLMGEVGTGKTTLIGVLLGRHYDLARIAYVMNPKLGFEEMLRVILEQLGYLSNAATKLELLRKFEGVFEQLRPKERIAIIVDEAQALSDETLEELRLFSNYSQRCAGHLEILLVGQPELLTRLMAPSLRQFHQRIGARAVLNSLERDEALEYIDYKLRNAGGSAHSIFADRALREIVAHSQGIPRQLNLLCNNALIRAYAAGLRWVSMKIALAAIQEYENLGQTPAKFREPFTRQVIRSITARPAISFAGLGLVALAGLYALGVMGMPYADLISRGETKSVVSRDVGQNREATVNPAPRVSTGSDTVVLHNVGAVGEALAKLLSPANDSEASKRAVDNVSSAPSSIPHTSVANPGSNTQPKSRDATTYSVQSGDTIEGIARRHFGSEVNIESVIKANPQLRNANRIYPGDTVFLPVESARRGEN